MVLNMMMVYEHLCSVLVKHVSAEDKGGDAREGDTVDYGSVSIA